MGQHSAWWQMGSHTQGIGQHELWKHMNTCGTVYALFLRYQKQITSGQMAQYLCLISVSVHPPCLRSEIYWGQLTSVS